MLRFGLIALIAATGLLAIACSAKNSDPLPANAAAASPAPPPPEPAESAPPRGVKRGDLLIVTLEGGKRVELQDKPLQKGNDDISGVRVHRYVGYEPAIRQHVLEVGHWEGREFVLLDDRTATKTAICGLPIISPSGRRFACGDTDIAYGSLGLQIWRVTPGRIDLELAKVVDRPPCTLSWLDDTHLRVVLCDYDGSARERLLYGLGGPTWRLEARCGGIKQPPRQEPRPPDRTPPGCEQGEQPIR